MSIFSQRCNLVIFAVRPASDHSGRRPRQLRSDFIPTWSCWCPTEFRAFPSDVPGCSATLTPDPAPTENRQLLMAIEDHHGTNSTPVTRPPPFEPIRKGYQSIDCSGLRKGLMWVRARVNGRITSNIRGQLVGQGLPRLPPPTPLAHLTPHQAPSFCISESTWYEGMHR